ncbi:MAG: glutamate synthase subunit beta [Candidatus Saganbacteria bacterium]|nr:glutamate synthase subunit beta [Candidatus Saganbacteria bacterium]
MGRPRGFIEIKRRAARYRPVCERVKDYYDVARLRTDAQSRDQASRCMDCGTPFCHWACPLGNYIPEWNDLVTNNQWDRALELLDVSNNLPEVTGRVCPALCEYACVLGINDDPVTVRENELAIIEHGFKHGLIKARPPQVRTGRSVAVVGSGPAGLACAAELNRMGHEVTVFEQADKIGGIMRYGVPDFKLEKHILDRRMDLWQNEGIKFRTKTEAGPAVIREFDAVCLATGCRTPRDLDIPGRQLNGIYFAMDYLTQSNKRVAGAKIQKDQLIDARDKKVVVIGGGDTGSDCVGTANRQGAECVVQIELLPEPPVCRDKACPWPVYPLLLKTTSSHEEGANRHWSILTKAFKGQDSRVTALACVKVRFAGRQMIEIPGSEFEIKADLVVLAVGFIKQELDPGWQNKKVFPAGDVQRGPSLVVWAIHEGREAAKAINRYLT